MLIERLDGVSVSQRDKLLYHDTILDNPYVKYKPYPKQAIPLILANKENTPNSKGEILPNYVLAGAGGFGGKTYLGTMAVVQYLREPDYTALVTRKNYGELLDTDSIWENAVDWCCDSERLGDLCCDYYKSPTPRIVAPNKKQNTIYFKAFDKEDQKGKLKSASYDCIVNDEASELEPGILSFQNRSLRNTSSIPLHVLNLSNPGGPSTEYLVENFVDGNFPYVSIDWRDNPYIDKEAYSGSLSQLDYIDQQYQKFGNWKYRPAQGDLINRAELKAHTINHNDYKDYTPLYNVIGIDKAAGGKDKTAALSLTLFENGKLILTNLYANSTPYPENDICTFVETEYNNYNTNIINFENEPGSDSLYSLRHWKQVLQDITYPHGIIVKGTPASHSKYNRARPIALAVKNNQLYFDDSLNLDDLFDQFIYIHPDPLVMKKNKSPDELDALGYAYTEIKKIMNSGVNVT